ncbi:25S rRNA (cytosine-C(5))-methyltransferase rcm1 [Dirofilaria immitis]
MDLFSHPKLHVPLVQSCVRNIMRSDQLQLSSHALAVIKSGSRIIPERSIPILMQFIEQCYMPGLSGTHLLPFYMFSLIFSLLRAMKKLQTLRRRAITILTSGPLQGSSKFPETIYAHLETSSPQYFFTFGHNPGEALSQMETVKHHQRDISGSIGRAASFAYPMTGGVAGLTSIVQALSVSVYLVGRSVGIGIAYSHVCQCMLIFTLREAIYVIQGWMCCEMSHGERRVRAEEIDSLADP